MVGEDNKLYRCGKPIYCNCTDKPTQYTYIDNTVTCPECGKTSIKIETTENTTDNIYLTYLGKDYNTMQDLYKLSQTIPYNIWNKIADYFIKLTPGQVDLGYEINYIGWVTSNPEKVEEILNIPSHLQVKNNTIAIENNKTITSDEINHTHSTESNRLNEIELFDIIDKLHEVFSVVETPYGEYNIKGKVIQNPLFPQNNYGTGECWIINKEDDEIWYVRNNFRPGDQLQFNNFLIDSELKAIGKVIRWDDDVVDLIQQLQ